jgi:hypothetical protein
LLLAVASVKHASFSCFPVSFMESSK